MSSLAEIYFNYNKAIRQAAALESQAQKLRRISGSDMQDVLQSVHSAWQSESSPAYLKKGQKVQRDVLTTSENLKRIAQTIRTVAGIIRDAELQAWRIAHERKN